jgi:hypothetical protein
VSTLIHKPLTHERVAEASRIFLRHAHVYQNYLAMRNTVWQVVSPSLSDRSLSQVQVLLILWSPFTTSMEEREMCYSFYRSLLMFYSNIKHIWYPVVAFQFPRRVDTDKREHNEHIHQTWTFYILLAYSKLQIELFTSIDHWRIVKRHDTSWQKDVHIRNRVFFTIRQNSRICVHISHI